MPSIYSSQFQLTDSTIGPQDENYANIPNLGQLTITDDFLQFGGTASITLYLGSAYSGDINSFSLYARIFETTTNTVVAEVNFGGGNGLSSLMAISAIYQIPANGQPNLQAQWKVLGSPGVVLMAPTIVSFSALVFESEG